MAPQLKSFALLGLLFTPFCAAACKRSDLRAAADDFINAARSNSKYPLSDTVKITQDFVVQHSLKDTVWTNITGVDRPWKIQIIDEEACQVASYVVVDEKQSSPALLSFRIKIAGPVGLPTEIELLNVVAHPDWVGYLFNTKKIPDHENVWWSSAQQSDPKSKPLTRDELLVVANKYANGIATGNLKSIPAHTPCVRVENGVKTTGQCNSMELNGTDINPADLAKLIASLKPTPGAPAAPIPTSFDMSTNIYSRRWTVDTLTGVTMGAYFFGTKPWGLFTHEFFAIKDGKIAEVQANWLPAKYGTQDVWAGGEHPDLFTDLPNPSPSPVA